MPVPTWSYSSITLFDQCPKKYYHLRVAKDIKEAESDAMIYGKELHKAAENYIKEGAAIPERFKFIEPMLEKLAALKGEKFCEYEMGIRKIESGFEPCSFFDKTAYYRGIADLLIVDRESESARLVDYKTGKSAQYADTKQLRLLAAATFIHFPEVKKIKAGLLFVVSQDFIREEYDHTQLHVYLDYFQPVVQQLEVALESGVFNPKRNFTCKNWCPVLDCQHNGKR